MLNLSENFHEQYHRVQRQFDEWTPFEQVYASVELTKKLQLSYRYFLSQLLFQNNNQLEHNDMFDHTVHQANTPAILACLLSDPLDKIISTLQLYLPLVSITTTNEKLLESYRNVFVYLDSKLSQSTNFSYTEQQLINHCQQIKFFIQTNPSLQKFLIDVPQLTTLASSTTKSNKANTDEQSVSPSSQRHHQPLQRYPSVRLSQHTAQATPPPPPPPLMNFSSDGSNNSSVCQQLLHNDGSDSGIDLSEPGLTNSVQNLLSSQTSQHTTIGRSHSANLTLNNDQDNQAHHPFVIKSSSSPTSEQPSSTRPAFVPLAGVLSAPAPSIHSYFSDFRQQNSAYSHQQIRPTLTISDEDEEEPHLQNFTSNTTQMMPKSMENFYAEINSTDNNNNNNNRLRQFSSLRTRNTKNYLDNTANHSESVSQYLGVDGISGSVRNTFIQPNSGMRDVPKWLKNLRLHKYAFFFSQMTYDQMMNLTIDQLKDGKITDGACTKILLNIKKLKERQTLLQQCLLDIDNGQTDVKTVLQQLNELMLTPIRAKQSGEENENDEDLPKLIMQLLEKVYQQLTSNTSSTTLLSDMCNNLVGLFDRCYKHEAFSANQRHTLLHWRGPLCNKLQTSGKIEFKSMQSSSSTVNRRTQLKPQTSMGNMNTTQLTKPAIRNIKSTVSYYPNYQPTSIPLSRQHNSDLLNQSGSNNNNNSTDANSIRRPVGSPALIFTTNSDSKDDTTTTTSLSNHLSIVSSHSLQEQSSYHQAQPFISERMGNGSGSLRPSFNYFTSTSSRSNGGYLAANQHQLLTRKTSIGPYGENKTEDKPKLCKTYSDPSRIRFGTPPQSSTQQSSTHLQISSPQTSYQVTSTPYSSRQYLSRSQPTPVDSNQLFDTDLISQSPIQKCYSDREASVFYGNDDNNNHHSIDTSPTNDTNTHDGKLVFNQRHNSAEFDTLCRQVTESAISDDVSHTGTDQKGPSDIQNIKLSSINSTDTE